MYLQEKQYTIEMILLCLVQGPWASSCVSIHVFRAKFNSAVTEEKSKMSRQIRGQGGLLYSDLPEKHKLGRGP